MPSSVWVLSLGMVFEVPPPCLAGSSQARDCCVSGVAAAFRVSELLALPAPAALRPPEEALGRVAGSGARSTGLHRSGECNSTADPAVRVTENIISSGIESTSLITNRATEKSYILSCNLSVVMLVLVFWNCAM